MLDAITTTKRIRNDYKKISLQQTKKISSRHVFMKLEIMSLNPSSKIYVR